MLTEKDINIFTIVKDKNTISPLRRWCIDSWKKCMPEANIMIFDDSDLNNPNWKYYDVIKNDKLWNYYKNRKDIYSNCDIKVYDQNDGSIGHNSPISTDSIRIRLLKAIPNALYMDSDAYLNITSKEFLELCNKYGDKDIVITEPWEDFNILMFTFTGFFAGAKTAFLDNIIKHYDSKPIKNVLLDHFEIRDFLKHNLNMYNHLYLNNYLTISHMGISKLYGGLDKFINYDIINVMIIGCDINYEFIRKHNLLYDCESFIEFLKKQCEKYIYGKTNYDLLSGHNKNNKPVFIIFINTLLFDFGFSKNFYDCGDYIISICNYILHIEFDTNNEFIQKLKETINIYLKSLLDNDKEINYYEILNLGDDPCLLKKI